MSATRTARARRGTVMVIAKAPQPGRVKTRLCPPCTPIQAATLATASLEDTFAAISAARDVRRVLVLSGPGGSWIPPDFEVFPQRGGGLDERLAWAYSDVMDGASGPAVLVGMDTPQLTAALLDAALDTLSAPGIGAVLGPALDGGWWGVGLRRPEPMAFLGIPMSTSMTWQEQRRRLRSLGLRVADLPALIDVDDMGSATEVARQAPSTRFAAALADLKLESAAALAGSA